ncbi:UNVERIFIED_CONTAM: hypothetical protein GTU68_060623 [Idotea baltica]|nr:hypothetical protein [Idotea baltica]
MQLFRDNLTLWTSDTQAEADDAKEATPTDPIPANLIYSTSPLAPLCKFSQKLRCHWPRHG